MLVCCDGTLYHYLLKSERRGMRVKMGKMSLQYNQVKERTGRGELKLVHVVVYTRVRNSKREEGIYKKGEQREYARAEGVESSREGVEWNDEVLSSKRMLRRWCRSRLLDRDPIHQRVVQLSISFQER